MVTLSKKNSKLLYQCQGALIILEYPNKPNFNEIIFRALENYLALIKDDADKEAFQVLGFEVK